TSTDDSAKTIIQQACILEESQDEEDTEECNKTHENIVIDLQK
ncbi:6397_t:CDS:2, partial [Racocetra persica]